MIAHIFYVKFLFEIQL